MEDKMEDKNVFNHFDNDHLSINVSAEKNTRGFNFSATVVNAKSPEDAVKALKDTMEQLKKEYGTEA
jgi:hypothetical protein